MVKNSHILPIFGLGLILSTSPLFTLLDSSLINVNHHIGQGNVEDGEEIQSPRTPETIKESVTSEPQEVATTEDKVEQSKEDSTSEVKTETSEKPLEPELTTPPDTREQSNTQTEESSPTHKVDESEAFEVAKSVDQTTPLPKTPNSQPQISLSTNTSSSQTDNKSITPKKYVSDYKSITETANGGVYRVTDLSGNQHFLYSPTEELSFALPDDQRDFQKVEKENIKISIFKQSAWSDGNKRADEYQELTREQINQLFKDREKNNDTKKRLKQILMSLSNRRDWSFYVNNDNYQSQLGKPTLVGVENSKGKKPSAATGMELKIKYFKEFEDLKDYIDKKMEICSAESSSGGKGGPCIAKEEELTIIDQDRTSFFKEAEKEKKKKK